MNRLEQAEQLERFAFGPDAWPTGGTWRLRPHMDGEWVRYSDVLNALTELEVADDGELREALERLERTVAHAWSMICASGTPEEIAPLRQAQKDARAALSQAALVEGDD